MIREIMEGDEVFVVKTRKMARVHRKKETPSGITTYGVRYIGEKPDERRDKYKRNYSDYCDAYCARKDINPLMI